MHAQSLSPPLRLPHRPGSGFERGSPCAWIQLLDHELRADSVIGQLVDVVAQPLEPLLLVG